jgi:hypothetical protein
MISAAAKSYASDITVNLYRNGKLIKSNRNDAMVGVAKLLLNIQASVPQGTTSQPVLSYVVTVSEPDPLKFESDAWIGQWNTATGQVNDLNDHLLSSLFAMPSGWRFVFKPDHLPFRMYVAASPYTQNGGKVTVTFFVNGQLVKSSSARDWIYGMEYMVQ